MKKIPLDVQDILKEIEGAKCCLKRIWRRRSLTIGFGNKIFHCDDSLIDNYNGE